MYIYMYVYSHYQSNVVLCEQDPDLRAFGPVLRIHRDSWYHPRHRLQYYEWVFY